MFKNYIFEFDGMKFRSQMASNEHFEKKKIFLNEKCYTKYVYLSGNFVHSLRETCKCFISSKSYRTKMAETFKAVFNREDNDPMFTKIHVKIQFTCTSPF